MISSEKCYLIISNHCKLYRPPNDLEKGKIPINLTFLHRADIIPYCVVCKIALLAMYVFTLYNFIFNRLPIHTSTQSLLKHAYKQLKFLKWIQYINKSRDYNMFNAVINAKIMSARFRSIEALVPNFGPSEAPEDEVEIASNFAQFIF